MKKFASIFLLLFQILIPKEIQAQWSVEKCPTSLNLNSVSFSRSGYGCIVGEKGTILVRNNGVWVKQDSPVNEDLLSVCVVDRDDVWIVGTRGTIIHFNGSVWEKFSCPVSGDLRSVAFRDRNNGAAAGSNGTLLIFSNGSWSSAGLPVRAELFTASYVDEFLIIGGGLEFLNVPVMRMKNNDPFTLENIFNSNVTVTGAAFSSPDNGWIVGSPSILLHFNGSAIENPSFDEKFPSLKAVAISQENSGIFAGYHGTIISLSGSELKKENSLTVENLNGATVNSNRYYVVGNKGTILTRLIDKEETKLRPLSENEANLNIYPNPNNGTFNLTMSDSNTTLPLIISITDVNGRMVAQKQLYSSEKDFHSVFELVSPAKGIYSVKVSSGDRTLYGKFIVN